MLLHRFFFFGVIFAYITVQLLTVQYSVLPASSKVREEAVILAEAFRGVGSSAPIGHASLITNRTTSRVVSDNTNARSNIAYAWLVGGVHEDRPGYRGFLYTVLISIYRLKKMQSGADFVVYVQMSAESTQETLPANEERFFADLGARLIYVDKPMSDSFASVVYEKFRPLQLIEYERVIFLDADLMPEQNLDYIMHLSLKGVIGPNFIMATRGEPCNAAFFMLQPEEGAWEELQVIIQNQREKAKTLPYPNFDRSEGWGHNFIQKHDHWEAIKMNGTRWRWFAVHSDQGLLYYWTKYHKMNTTIFIGEKVQTWQPGGKHGNPKLVAQDFNLLDQHAMPRAGCDVGRWECAVPYREWVHFSGGKKPWTKKVLGTKKQKDWYAYLKELNTDLDMGIPDDWEGVYQELKEIPLGAMALWKDHAVHVQTNNVSNA